MTDNRVIRFLKWLRPPMNFLTIHYIFIISSSLFGSLMIFAGGNIAYIDALFFSTGGCTQAGLNTVDVNLLNTWQQFWIFWMAMQCNIVVINTAVVVTRLFWFERRFQHIVKASREFVRSRSIGRNSISSGADRDVERAINGRRIRVLFDSGKPMNPTKPLPLTQEPENMDVSQQIHGLKVEEQEQEQEAPRESGGSADSARKSSSSTQLDKEGRAARMNEDEITPNPLVQERHGRDIRFGDLPHPRQLREQENNEALRNESAIEDDEGIGRIPTMEKTGTHSRRNSMQARLRRATSGALPRAATFERVLSNTFGRRRRDGSPNSATSRRSTQTQMTLPYFTFTPTVGRNSFFVGLTEEQKEELGGVEYRAVKTLLFVLIAYFLALLFLSWICLVPWIMRSSEFGPAVTEAGIGRPWWGIFTGASMFNDLGYTLTANSMIPFQTAVFPLLLGSFLIISGNTGFPCLLRLIIWIMFKVSPQGSALKETLAFLLDHPRRCFTLLFPSSATWWLFAVLVILNLCDLFFFLVLDLGDAYILQIPVGYRILDGFFQAVSTRTAGFAVTNLELLHPAVLVSYLVMMYISIYPVAISIRRTNVYEERSLGIYAPEDEENPSFIATHIRRQLSFDLWYIFLGLFLICIIEADQISDTNDYWFNIFNVLFEVVSGYACVGLSLGYPTVNASFASQFKTLSKLVMIALMIRGRHRGLPYALDKAIMLPSRLKSDDETPPHRPSRRMSMASMMTGRRRSSQASAAGIDHARVE